MFWKKKVIFYFSLQEKKKLKWLVEILRMK